MQSKIQLSHLSSLSCVAATLSERAAVTQAMRMTTHGAHKRVQHGHCKGCSTSKRLSHVQFKIVIIIIIDVQVLYILIKSYHKKRNEKRKTNV